MKTLLYSQIRNIAEHVRTNPAIRFWDEDEDGNLQELGEDNIVRYLNDFLPAAGIFSLPDQESKGVPRHQLIYFFENRVALFQSRTRRAPARFSPGCQSGYGPVFQVIAL